MPRGEPLYETTARTGGEGSADPEGPAEGNVKVNRSALWDITVAAGSEDFLPAGAYIIRVQAVSDGEQLEGFNFFMVAPEGHVPENNPRDSESNWLDNRLFVVPLNADGTAVRAELVDQLEVEGGEILPVVFFDSAVIRHTGWPGVLVDIAELGAEVTVTLGGFQAVISKPIGARIVPLRVP